MWIVAPNPVSQHDDEHSVESVTVGVSAVGKAVNERDEQRWAKATGEACGAGGRACTRSPAMLDGPRSQQSSGTVPFGGPIPELWPSGVGADTFQNQV